MHYMPAALIGEFAAADNAGKRRARDKAVWVARRGMPRPFPSRARDVGYDADNPRLYQSPSMDIDWLWQRAERDHHAVQELVAGIRATGVVPAISFANVLAPYAAHLVARHPSLVLDGDRSDLVENSATHDTGLQLRLDAFPRLADAFLTARRWLLVTAPAGVELVTTDIGWQYMPGQVPGEVFIPVTPRDALVIRGGGRSYHPTSEFLEIPVVDDWEPWMLEIRRDVMILTAPHEVYAPSEELAAHALRLWDQPPPDTQPFVDGATANAHDLALVTTRAMPDLLQQDAAHDSALAFARMIAIQHRWSCQCEQQLGSINDRTARDIARRRMHDALKLAEASLREQGLLT